jgi:hypothetical protein
VGDEVSGDARSGSNVTTVIRRGIIALVASMALVGCAGLGAAGSAATVGDVQVSTQTLASETAAILVPRGGQSGAPDSALTLAVLQRLVVTELVGQVAATQGITVTQGEIDASIAEFEAQLGGAEALQAAYLEANVPAEAIEQQVTLSLQVRKLGAALAPDGDQNAQEQALVEFVTVYGEQEGIEVSPRFGTWDTATLTVGPLPSDLSTTEQVADPLAGVLPAP